MKLQFLWEPYCYILFSTTTWKVIPHNLQSIHICLIVTHMVPRICKMHLAFILQTCLNQNNQISLSVLKMCLTGFHLLTDFFFFKFLQLWSFWLHWHLPIGQGWRVHLWQKSTNRVAFCLLTIIFWYWIYCHEKAI